MKNLLSITVRLTEKDPAKLHSNESIEKLEMCAQAIEIGTAISLAVSGLTGLDHKIFADEERMQVSLVYAVPDRIKDEKWMSEFFMKYAAERGRLQKSFEQSKKSLAEEGIELESKIFSIEPSEIPV